MKSLNINLKYWLLLLMPLLLVACDNDNPPAAVTLTEIAVSPAAVPDGLPVDLTQAFTATGTYSNNSKQDVTKTVTWNSSASAMATIDANGAATGVAAGATSITASLSGKTSNTVSLNVINPDLVSLVVTPASVPNKLQVGRTQAFKAEGVFDNNKSYDVTQWVDWNSSDKVAADFVKPVEQPGVVTAGTAAGATNITASTTPPSVTSNVVALVVVAPTATGMIIEPQTFDALPVNRKQQLIALLKFDNNSLLDITNSSTWVSSDTAVATVVTSTTGAGQVTGVATGTATITVSDNGGSSQAATVDVTVNDATITAVSVSPANPNNLPAGYTQDFTATGTFTDGKTRKLVDPISWAIDDTAIASIDLLGESAQVTGLKAGAVTVSYNDVLADGKASGKAGSSQLTVTDAILTGIATNPSAAFSIPLGGQTNFTAMGSYSDDVGRDITSSVIWESDAASVVVDSTGKLTALSAGSANVSARAQNTATPPAVFSSADVNVTVTGGTLDSLTINPTGDVIVNETRLFTVTATFVTPPSSSNYTQRVVWTSSDQAIATVSNVDGTRGEVTGVMAGIFTLTATDPETDKTTSLDIPVSQP